MDVKNIINHIYKKYMTLDPYEIADCLNIIVHYMPLGKMRGFFYHDKQIKQIFLNCGMEHYIEKFVLAHEIGHVIMHPKQNTPFLQSTFFSVNRLEIQANKFATELIIPDVELMEHWEYTIDELAMFYGLPRELIELRLKD